MKTKRRRDESPHRAPRRPCRMKRRKNSLTCTEQSPTLGSKPPDTFFLRDQALDLPNNYKLNKQHFEELRSLLPNLKTLNLECCPTLSDQDLASLVGFEATSSDTTVLEAVDDAKTMMLEHLNLTRTNIGDVGVAALVMKCKNLKYLFLSHTKITDVSLSLIAKHCPGLHTIDVTGCNVGNYGIQLIAQECNKSLVSLVVNDCHRVNDAIIPYLCYYCPSLSQLGIRNTQIPARGVSVLLHKLRFAELDCQGLPITDDQLERLTRQQHQTIKKLHLSFCYNLSAECIARCINSCKQLEEAHLYGLCLDATVTSIKRDGLTLYWC